MSLEGLKLTLQERWLNSYRGKLFASTTNKRKRRKERKKQRENKNKRDLKRTKRLRARIRAPRALTLNRARVRVRVSGWGWAKQSPRRLRPGAREFIQIRASVVARCKDREMN